MIEFFTSTAMLAFLQVVMIDLVLAGDNAIVIGLAAAGLPKEQRTKAILAPNLVGNCPDWDAIRTIADRHGLVVTEDSCDVLDSYLRGRRTGTRSHISVTSFARSHSITAASNGGKPRL